MINTYKSTKNKLHPQEEVQKCGEMFLFGGGECGETRTKLKRQVAIVLLFFLTNNLRGGDIQFRKVLNFGFSNLVNP